MKQRILSILIPCVVAWLCTWISVQYYSEYAWGLFIYLPVFIGAASTLILRHNNTVSVKALIGNSYLTLLLYCLGLMIVAFEGLICILMAAPLELIGTFVGYVIGSYLFRSHGSGPKAVILVLIILGPALMAFESRIESTEPLRSITTSIEIDASPQEVWKHVIEFPPLQAPEELLFRSGIAYPVSATIRGKGVGAVRYCNFSTGPFIEPITTWQEGSLLQFSVVQQPAPMKEISFTAIHPKHLDGYWQSKKGQFRLIKLPNGRTRLEGTTWYTNQIKPAFYWDLWSDYIVHSIHRRVLNHIRQNAEAKS